MKDIHEIDKQLADMIAQTSKKVQPLVVSASTIVEKTKAATEAAQAIRVDPAVLDAVAKQAANARAITAQTAQTVADIHRRIKNFESVSQRLSRKFG